VPFFFIFGVELDCGFMVDEFHLVHLMHKYLFIFVAIDVLKKKIVNIKSAISHSIPNPKKNNNRKNHPSSPKSLKKITIFEPQNQFLK